MLLPSLFSVVDGNTTIIYQYILADVIAMVADVIATWLQVVIAVVIATCFQFNWLMLLPWWLMLLSVISIVCWLMLLPWW